MTSDSGLPTTFRTRKARPTGLAVAALGIVVLNVSPFLDWVENTDDATVYSGYETDSLIPFIAYLGIGLLVALGLAYQRAHRNQHRGLTLVSLAVAVAAALQSLAFAIDPMGALERGENLEVQYGVWVALIGAVIWAAGSALFAQDVEGDDDVDHRHVADPAGYGR
ncbi:hypothetical protein LWF15_13560 [Kineosporia rhizophila]|uniref:hypothetical protein n=1 Tax=Kineosporia rhizophila TaxID=84633 RepID=UPI000B03E3AD|nr:hypothetical protein [Kineosporia rhizophila]MCE0536539.1 hypothetical protein [Kineosporia rhizophila]